MSIQLKGLTTVVGCFSPSYIKTLLLSEVEQVQGLMRLLMKPRNKMRWLPEDKVLLRGHLKRLARTLPLLGVFALPGGSILMPLLAIFLDRRRASRRSAPNTRPFVQRDVR